MGNSPAKKKGLQPLSGSSIDTDSRSRPQRQFRGHVWSVANTAPCTSFSRLADVRLFGMFFCGGLRAVAGSCGVKQWLKVQGISESMV